MFMEHSLQKALKTMKPILLAAALALPLAFSGCGTYVGYDGGYGPGYYVYGGPGYYDGVYGDVAVYGYDRGGYRPHSHHYDGGYHGAVASRGFSHGSGTRIASAGHSGGGGGAAHASASGGGHR
jgi:hypothetical protein